MQNHLKTLSNTSVFVNRPKYDSLLSVVALLRFISPTREKAPSKKRRRQLAGWATASCVELAEWHLLEAGDYTMLKGSTFLFLGGSIPLTEELSTFSTHFLKAVLPGRGGIKIRLTEIKARIFFLPPAFVFSPHSPSFPPSLFLCLFNLTARVVITT